MGLTRTLQESVRSYTESQLVRGGSETDGITASEYGTDPRKQGDLCYGGYWNTYYIVLRVDRDENGHMTQIHVLNLQHPNEQVESGTLNFKSHMTRWDGRRDRIVAKDLFSRIPDPENGDPIVSDADGGFMCYPSFDYFIGFARELCKDYDLVRASRRF